MPSAQWGRLTNAGKNNSIQAILVDLKACSRARDLKMGREVHEEAVARGHGSNVYVLSALVRMYSKCGSIVDARRLFETIEKPDAVTWTALLMGYAENVEGSVALDLFSKMKASGCAPDALTYISALKACTSLAVDGDSSKKRYALERGREIHMEMNCNLHLYIQSALIDMYAKCGSIADAHCVFDNINKPDVACWNALLLGYAENGEGLRTLDLFSSMKESKCAPSSVTYVAALKACTSLAVDGGASGKKKCLELGREIHLEIGSRLNHYVQTTLIAMYAKCGSLAQAHSVFDGIQQPNVASWNALLLGYAENGLGSAALELFSRMKASGFAPDAVTYVAALKACTSLAVDGDASGKKLGLERGREIHLEIGSNSDIYVQSTLIDMYVKCGRIVEAHRVFERIQKPNVVCWNALLLGCAENGEGMLVLDMFTILKASACVPNALTYIAALKACSMVGALGLGRKLHSEITEFTAPLVTCLVDFYGKCGSMVEAHEVFHLHSTARTIATWNALIGGYGRLGDSETVFNLFEAMQDKGFRPDAVTLLCMLSCCSHAGLVVKARKYFEGMDVRYGVTPTVVHYNCMIDLLGRANLLNEAVGLLKRLPCKPDAITWMALLGACRKWKNVELGRIAFQYLVNTGEDTASAHVLMSQIYRSKGMVAEEERVLATRTRNGAAKVVLPGETYVLNEAGEIVKFLEGEQGPPDVEEKLQEFCRDMKGQDYTAESYSNVRAAENEVSLCGHSERRAAVYGILKAPCGEPVRVFKNRRTCDECHGSIKMISKLSGRVIMLRDASRFHVIVNGNCSCGNYW